MKKVLSVIVPAYNEEDMIHTATATIAALLEENGIAYELIFIDDGSRDATWKNIIDETAKNEYVAGIHFSRNFGKESAMFAGLEKATGDCCVILDCDLQHPPCKIIEMYRLWEQGYEVIEGVKQDRGKESMVHRTAANTFYGIISCLTNMDMRNSSDFKLLDRKVVDALNALPEKQPFFRALSYWVGFKSTSVTYEVQERVCGKSKWSAGRLVSYAISNITAFSAAPLKLVNYAGWILFAVTIILTIQTLVKKFTGAALEGFTTVIVLQCFIGSVLMISIGIIGYYIEKIYNEIKGRPRYIISQVAGRIQNN